MKILQIIDSLNPGGAERMVVNISNVLQASGHKVIICTSRETGALEKFVVPDVQVILLKKRNAFDLNAFIRLGSIVRKYKINIIHAHSSSIFWAVATKLFNPNIKLIWHDHYGLSENLTNSSRIGLQKLSPLIDGIISVNETLRTWSINNMRVAPNKIFFIHNFPLLQILPKTTTGLTTIVCLANLRPQKDHPTLARAIHYIKTKYPELKLKVIFAGLYWHDDYYNKLIELIDELKLNDTIEIHGPVDNIAGLLAMVNIGVLSSLSEGLPVSLLEYGLNELPVVVTDVGQCSEVVGNGIYGKVVPPSNPLLLAKELIWIIQNPELALKMGTAFRTYVQQQYGEDRFLSEYNELLKNIF